jgi:short-subunit dehydrogenase
MRALIVGATAGVGRALSEDLCALGVSLLLAASDERDLNALANHLRLVYGTEVEIVAANASCIERFIDTVATAAQSFGAIDSLYFPIGLSYANDSGFQDQLQIIKILNANLTVVISVITHFLPQMLLLPSANIVGFGSISAVRGRKVNMVYGAAKRGLESYFESLRHLTASSGVRVQFYRLGYIKTQQSFGKQLLFPAVTPKEISKLVLRNYGKDIGRIHFPRFWAIVSIVIKTLPWPLYKNLDF